MSDGSSSFSQFSDPNWSITLPYCNDCFHSDSFAVVFEGPSVFYWFQYDLRVCALMSIANLFFYSVIGLYFFRKDRKRLAWVVSSVNSATMLLHGIIFLIARSSDLVKILTWQLSTSSFFQQRDDFSGYLCIWFAVANIWDVVFGCLFYREKLDPLTAYVHHTSFVIISYMAVKGDLFGFKVDPFSTAFVFMAIEELPTFLLAFGTIFPQFRTDIGFGVTFALFRLIFHLWIFSYGYTHGGISSTLTILFVLTMTLHLHWFINWVSKYGRRLLELKHKQKQQKKV